MNYAIIVAGGVGSRMAGSDIPKQFIEIAGKPVIVHTIEAFINSVSDINIIVTISHQWQEHWIQISNKFFSDKNIISTEGGDTRFHSVKNGLKFTTPSSVVAVHDAVRPVISGELISKAMEHARKNITAIPFIYISDSLRKKGKNTSIIVDRNEYIIIQTPQCFQQEILVNAYTQDYNRKFTDDASVVEASGIELSFIEGNKNNIKITVQEDLKFVECLLKK